MPAKVGFMLEGAAAGPPPRKRPATRRDVPRRAWCKAEVETVSSARGTPSASSSCYTCSPSEEEKKKKDKAGGKDRCKKDKKGSSDKSDRGPFGAGVKISYGDK